MTRRNYDQQSYRQQSQQYNRDTRQDIYCSDISWPMPFGRHKGKPICSVPLDYLRYICSSTNNVRMAMRCNDEIMRRRRIGRAD